jgi:hypothetical protein
VASSYSFPWLLRWDRTQANLRLLRRMLWSGLLVGSISWLSCLLWLIYHRVGIDGQHYFWTWIISSCLGEMPILCALRLPYAGGGYAAADIAASLTQHIYQQSFWAWCRDEALLSAVAPVSLLGLLLYKQAQRTAAERPAGEHVRGVQLITPDLLQRRLQSERRPSWWRAAFPAHRSAQHEGIPFAGLVIPQDLFRLHALITGSTGMGKSTVVRTFLEWLAAHGQTAIVVDPEREFVQQFYSPARGDVILNPFDQRCPHWSPWLELAAPEDAVALAKSLLPDPPGRGVTNELYFRQSARQLFVHLLHRLPSRDPQDIPKMLFGPPAALTQLLAGTPAASLIDPSAAPQRQAIVSTLQLAVEGFRFLPPPGEQIWSARTWAAQRTGWIFLTFQEQQSDALLPLLSLWLDLLIGRLLDTELERAEHDPAWVVIDELAAVGRQQHLEALLTRGRKHGVQAVIGFQAITQLQERYGAVTAATLLAAPAIKLFFRTGEPTTAEWCSQAIGEREVVRAEVSATSGSADSRDAFSVSRHRRREPLVLSSELQQLPRFTGYLCVAGNDVARVTIPASTVARHHPGFLPRAVNPTTAMLASPQPPTTAVPSAPLPPRVSDGRENTRVGQEEEDITVQEPAVRITPRGERRF